MLRRASNVDDLCDRRRANFSHLLKGLSGLRHCRPLFAELPEGVVPYMFPLVVEQPAQRFHWLKHLGVPIFRWDELAESNCRVSAHYRLHLLHLPCHQSMSPAELEWMTLAVSTVMSSPAEEDL
jgi:perosamine synthetase